MPSQTVTLSFYRFESLAARVWAFFMMGAARLPLSRMEGLDFWKLCGGGRGEGFTPRFDLGVAAILCVWHDEGAARESLSSAPLFQRYRSVARETWTVFLRPLSARGYWSGRAPFSPGASTQGGPVAALTRATIRPRILLRFWDRVPSISRSIGADRNVRFKMGIGEVPFLHQVTFSIWPDTASMAAFARADGVHADAVRAVREGRWFREELYARFAVLSAEGHWDGKQPLAEFAPG